MKDLQRRVGRLEGVQVAEEEFQLVIVDETLPDGTMLRNGRPVAVRPGREGLTIRRRARRDCITPSAGEA